MSSSRYDHTRAGGGTGTVLNDPSAPWTFVDDGDLVEVEGVRMTRVKARAWLTELLAALDAADRDYPIEVTE